MKIKKLKWNLPDFRLYFLFVFLFTSCGKADKPVQQAQLSIMPPVSLHDLHQKRVKELFIVLFEKDFSITEWKIIFDETKKLSVNKKRLRKIEGDFSAREKREAWINENAVLLDDLGKRSLFMLDWTLQDENCKFIEKKDLRLVCKPHTLDNPLNGGLPENKSPITWVVPDPVRYDIKNPYLKINLSLNNERYDYDLELRLQLESKDEKREWWFKGDVVKSVPHSKVKFTREDGSESSSLYPYGYAEMTVSQN